MDKIELKPIHDTAKSFYKKAYTVLEDFKIKLFSYNTMVGYIENNKAYINGFYSRTTTRHIKEFLKQYGFKVINSKQIFRDYISISEFSQSNNQYIMFE